MTFGQFLCSVSYCYAATPPPDYVFNLSKNFNKDMVSFSFHQIFFIFCGYTGTRTQTIWRGHQTCGNPTSCLTSFVSTFHKCTHISSQDRIRTCNCNKGLTTVITNLCYHSVDWRDPSLSSFYCNDIPITPPDYIKTPLSIQLTGVMAVLIAELGINCLAPLRDGFYRP